MFRLVVGAFLLQTACKAQLRLAACNTATIEQQWKLSPGVAPGDSKVRQGE